MNGTHFSWKQQMGLEAVQTLLLVDGVINSCKIWQGLTNLFGGVFVERKSSGSKWLFLLNVGDIMEYQMTQDNMNSFEIAKSHIGEGYAGANF